MKRLVIGAMRVVAGAGGAIFLALAVAASMLMFFAYHQGSLMLDHHGPYWRYGRVALGCWFTSALWWLMWRLLPSARQTGETPGTSPVAERGFTIGILTTTPL